MGRNDEREDLKRQDQERNYRDPSPGTPANSGRQGYTRHGEGNPWSGARESSIGRGDTGFEAGSGTEGWGTQGAQGYGQYQDQNKQVSQREFSNDNSRNQRHYGIQGGGGYGVYDIGGQGAKGYHREYDGHFTTDQDFGTRHWGRGEFNGREHASTMMEKLGERIGETVGRFFGKGPKGYRRSDERIKEDVSEALYIHHDVDATDIEVQVADGVVTLAGFVESRRTKRLAEDALEHVAGVRDILNHLRVRGAGENSTTDSTSSHH